MVEESRQSQTEEFDEDAIYRSPACEKWEYKKIIYAPEGHIDASPRWDFYAAAKASVQRLVVGSTVGEIEGTAALYLFRHYLELALKSIVLGARHLETKDKNMLSEQVLPPSQGHDLKALWNEVKSRVPRKLGAGVWPQWDHKFVEQCIEEFHVLDPSSERLRYKHEKQYVERDQTDPLRVDWQALLYAIEHVHDVLEAMHTYLIETHGLNADWEEEQRSW